MEKNKVKTNGFTHKKYQENRLNERQFHQRNSRNQDIKLTKDRLNEIRKLVVVPNEQSTNNSDKPNRNSGEFGQCGSDSFNDSHKKKLADIAAKRSNRIKRIGSNYRNDEVEIERRERRDKILSRAEYCNLENQEEMRDFNKKLADVRCFAMRDAQIKENKKIRLRQQIEDLQLDELMQAEYNRKNALEDAKYEEKQRQRPIEAKKLLDQIAERDYQRICDKEQKFIDNEKLCAQFKADEEKKMKDQLAKIELNRTQRAEIEKINEEMKLHKKLEKEREIEENSKILEEQRRIDERRDELERNANAKRAEREKEINEMRSRQKAEFDNRAEREEARARRDREIADRNWRLKDLREKQAKRKLEQALKIDRLAQLEAKRVEEKKIREQERAAVENLNIQMKQQDIESKRKYQEKMRLKHQYKQDLLEQAREKQNFMLNQKKLEQSLVNAARSEEISMKLKIQNLKDNKLNNLLENGINEKYLNNLRQS